MQALQSQLTANGMLAGVPMFHDAGSMAPPVPGPVVTAAADAAIREATLRGLTPFLFILATGRVRLMALGKAGADIVEKPIQEASHVGA